MDSPLGDSRGWFDRRDGAQPGRASRNVVLVTADGVRWQEVFRGAEVTAVGSWDLYPFIFNVDAAASTSTRGGCPSKGHR